MKFSVVSYHVPDPEGSAAGRILLATCDGLIAEGHEVEVWSWQPDQPTFALPPWCTWRPLGAESRVRTRARALMRPRSDIVQAGWSPPEDAVAVADDFISFAAVAASPRSVVTFHYLTFLDARALARHSAREMQERRAERRAARRAALVLAYSPRVTGSLTVPANVVPIALPVPPAPIEMVEAPVAAVMADWRWPPNRWALDRLLRAWPAVRLRVPSARLLLGGRELRDVGTIAGVEVLGRVAQGVDILAQACVLPFPCPATSGPKVKVLDALAHGLPVVTTPAGVEGVAGGRDGAVITSIPGFADALADVLLDPERRGALGAAGRAGVVAVHGPRPAARARLAVCQTAFASDQLPRGA